METTGQQVYGFWDGDYTFHHAEYDDASFNHTFRVRIDNASPENRARQNVSNLNKAQAGWKSLRPATQEEINIWLYLFKRSYPLRPKSATEALRHLALHGATVASTLPPDKEAALRDLLSPRSIIRNFRPEQTMLVAVIGGHYTLTDDGRWLTALMK